MSQTMQEWGNDAGISKHLYKVGFTDDAPADAVKELSDSGYGGQNDWTLLDTREADSLDQNALMGRITNRMKLIDPLYYPKLKGAKDIVRLDQRKVEASIVIKLTMEGRASKVPKLKPKDMAGFILDVALGDSSI
jgi:hypothetical protein